MRKSLLEPEAEVCPAKSSALRRLATLVAEARTVGLLERALELACEALEARTVFLFQGPGSLRACLGLDHLEHPDRLIEQLHRSLREDQAEDFPRVAADLLQDERSRTAEVVLLKPRPDSTPREFLVALRWKPTPVHPSTRAVVEALLGAGLDRLQRSSSEVQFADIVEHAHEVILVTDTAGHIKYVNPAFEKVTGYRRSEAIGRKPSMLKSGVHSDEFYRDLWNTVSHGESWTGELTNRRKDGSHYKEDAVITPIREPGGKIVQYLKVMRDVTEERRLERDLRRSQRLEALGTLAGGISHDFNNILTAILGFSELVQKESEDPVAGLHAAEITRAGKRAKKLVSQILTFSRRSESEERRRPVALRPLVDEVVDLLRVGLSNQIRLRVKVEPGLAVLADPTQVHQVLMNLCTNSGQAMPNGGTLAIRLRSINRGAPGRPASKPRGPVVEIEVEDSGVGIPTDHLDRIFDPYYTTKGQGEGTGLGLSVVHGIVSQLGGAIDVASEVNVGTRITVLLPQAQEIVRAASEARMGEGLGRGECVLLVDDESQILRAFEIALRRFGFLPTTCPTAEAALQAVLTGSCRPGIMITDQTMPGLSGLQLSRLLTEQGERFPILLCTGVRDRRVLDGAREVGINRVLTKPVSPTDLALAIRETLDTSRFETR